MAKRDSRFSDSLRQVGEIPVNEWDFMALLHKDIGDLDIARSLRKLGNIHVMDWDFRSVLPAVNKLANREVDLVDIIKRTAGYKVMEWDFRSALPGESTSAGNRTEKPSQPDLHGADLDAVVGRLTEFIRYVAVNLIDEPKHMRIKVEQLEQDVLRFRLVLVKRDVSMLIGREGHTAAAIRSILKSRASVDGIQALLQIHSHEEEMVNMRGA